MTSTRRNPLAVLVVVGCLFAGGSARAEVGGVAQPARLQGWPISVAVRLGSLGFYPQGVNPSVIVGTEYSLTRGSTYELALAASLGSVYFRENLVGGLVEIAAVNRWRTRFGLYAEAAVGAGYQLTFFPGTTYVAKGGSFAVGGNDPTSMLQARVGAGVGFDFGSLGWRPVRISALYSAFVLTPYATGNGIPVLPGAQVMVALSVPLNFGGQRPL